MNKIVNSESMFTLLSIYQKVDENDMVEIVVDGKDYTKIILIINSLQDIKLFLKMVNGLEGRFIDIEILENKRMDFWSEDYHIGTFNFDSYEETIHDYNREDWMEYAERLQNNLETRNEELRNTRQLSSSKSEFINDLILFLNKEIDNTKLKNTFLKSTNRIEKVNTEKLRLAESVLRIIETNKTKWNI